MNASTGIKSRASAVEHLKNLAARKPVEPAKPDAKTPPETVARLNAQQSYAAAEAKLDQLAIRNALEMLADLPVEIDVVNVTLRTSAGPQKLLNVHIVTH